MLVELPPSDGPDGVWVNTDRVEQLYQNGNRAVVVFVGGRELVTAYLSIDDLARRLTDPDYY